MNDSSNDILASVGPGQIQVLLGILRDSDWRNREFVEDRYRESASNFGETLRFLQQLGWVRTDGTEIRIVAGWMDGTAEQDARPFSVALLEALLDSPGALQRAIANYLACFQNIDGVVSCLARGELALADAPARNFLMELGAVRHDPANKAHFLDPAFFGAYVWALALRGPHTQAELIDSIEDRQRLGRGAELAVVAFERQRLGTRWADRVLHVADKHPAALYDVKSVTVTGETATPRYIEVKAVSPLDLAFHWSTAEIETARLLQSSFYLYLVPLRGPNDFDLAGLQMIVDPFVQVYSQTAAWDKLPTHFLCRPARLSIS
jgi:hypothetical protein